MKKPPVPMLRQLNRTLLTTIMACWPGLPALANETSFGEIQIAQNLHIDGERAAALQKPIVLFVTASYCSFCETLREEVFRFLPNDPRFVLRELVVDSDGALIDFNGETASPARLANRYDAALTPTVLFLGSNGQTLAEPLIGVLTLDFYNYYFEEQLNVAQDHLSNTSS